MQDMDMDESLRCTVSQIGAGVPTSSHFMVDRLQDKVLKM